MDEEPPCLQPKITHDAEKSSALSTWLTVAILFMHVRYRLAEKVTSRIFAVLKVLLQIWSKFCYFCAKVASAFPPTFHQALKKHNVNFKRYVVCKKCHQVYYLSELLLTSWP